MQVTPSQVQYWQDLVVHDWAIIAAIFGGAWKLGRTMRQMPDAVADKAAEKVKIHVDERLIAHGKILEAHEKLDEDRHNEGKLFDEAIKSQIALTAQRLDGIAITLTSLDQHKMLVVGELGQIKGKLGIS